MLLKKHLVYSLLFLFSTQIFGQDIVTDRPDQTESSSTVGKNALQIESGISFVTYGDAKSFSGPSALFRIGILEPLELRLLVQYEATKLKLQQGKVDYNGLNDLEIGAKVQLLKKEEVGTEIAFLSHVVIPTAKDELSNAKVGTINKLSISHEISEKIGLGYNIGYDYMGQQSALTYSMALGFSLAENLGFYVEPYGSWAEQNQFESNFDTGLTYLLNPNFQLDVSYGLGLNNDMRYVSAGFSWKIPEVLAKK